MLQKDLDRFNRTVQCVYMYGLGSGSREIGKVLGISHVAVLNAVARGRGDRKVMESVEMRRLAAVEKEREFWRAHG